MAHVTREQIEGYIHADSNETEQEEIEQHFEGCEACFDVYLELLEEQTVDFELSDTFTENIVTKINQQNPSQSNKKASSTNNAVVNYFLAAGLTIILMLTGVFQNFLSITDVNDQQDQVSVTEQLMDKTNNILDQIKGDFK